MSLVSWSGEKEVIVPANPKSEFAQFTSLSKFTSLASLDTNTINQSITQSVSQLSVAPSTAQIDKPSNNDSTSQSSTQIASQASTQPTSKSTTDDLLASLFELESVEKIVEESSLANWGLGEIEEAIATMERERQRENEQQIADNVAAVSKTASLAALPHQRGYSQQIHSALLEQYSKLKKLNGQTPKQAFLSRKKKNQQARQAKKAESVFDKHSNKLQNARNKNKARSKAKY